MDGPGKAASPGAPVDGDQAEALLRASFDAVLDPQMLIEAVRDEAGQIVDFAYRDVNRATCEALGVAKDELVGRRLRDTLPGFEESGLFQRYAACIADGHAVVLDGYSYRLRSDTRHCDVRAGRTNHNVVTVTWRDVTDNVATIRRIAESEEQFRLLAHNLGEAVFRIDNDGAIIWMSTSAEEQFGSADTKVGRRLGEFMPPEEAADHLARLRAANRGESRVGRIRAFGADGEIHWIHYFLKPFYGADGVPDGLVLTCRLIDAEVEAEQRAEEARRLQAQADDRWRRMMETSAVGMAISDPSGRFETVNQALCDFFGYDEESLKQLTWQQLTPPEFLDADVAAAEKLRTGDLDAYRSVKQFFHPDGHRVWGDLSASVLRTPDGGIEGYIAQITDVTAEVEARRQLTRREEQNRSLAKRLQAKTDRLSAELQSAADYISSILPGRLDGTVAVTSRYLASQELAGDCFDFRWIDVDHLIVYLLDVSGHGVQSALLSVSVHNLLRSGSLPAAVLMQPNRVLAELNEVFAMDKHAGNYFTMWYGVFEVSTRTLRYGSGGHPPALLLTAANGSVMSLSSGGMPVGMFPDAEFTCATAPIAAGDTVLIYSDGVYELSVPAGQNWSLPNFTALCTRLAATPGWTLDTLVDSLRARTVDGVFDDDLSLVRLDF